MCSPGILSSHRCFTVGGNQNLRYLRSGKLRRGIFTARQHFTDASTAQAEVVGVVMRTGLGRSHVSTAGAVKTILEEERGDAKLIFAVFTEDVLRVIIAV